MNGQRSDTEKNNLIEEAKKNQKNKTKKTKKGIDEVINCNEIINNSLKP